MGKSTLFLFLILSLITNLLSQTENIGTIGSSIQYETVNGVKMQRTVTTHSGMTKYFESNAEEPVIFQNAGFDNSEIRWSFTDPIAIGDRNATSGNGLYQVVGWGLNTQRISLYTNANNTPLWEYLTDPTVFSNYVAISDTGGKIAAASLKQILSFNRTSSTPVLNFDLSTLPIATAVGSAIDITSNGRFIIAGTSPSVFGDSSYILGFYSDSTQPAWRITVGQTNAGGSGIQGVKIAGNDSLAIVNTYAAFYVIRTYTGQILYQGLVNPTSNNGTQAPQAISANGNYIATINYNGFVRVYQRTGNNTYNFLWQHQEPPGAFINWMTTVDITDDGQYLACGTLNFLSTTSYDGKVKLFRTTNSTPIWTYTGFGDEVQCVAFSKNGNVLAAASWGDFDGLNNDMVVWKISSMTNVPLFGANAAGSAFWCSVSNDGSTATFSGKRVHARQFGNGGEVYNVFVDTNAIVGITGNNNTPYEYRLIQNYPNPFNPSTTISYELQSANNVKVTIFDITGKEIAILVNQKQNAGRYEVTWNASEYASGIYFYKIESGDFNDTKKMILIK